MGRVGGVGSSVGRVEGESAWLILSWEMRGRGMCGGGVLGGIDLVDLMTWNLFNAAMALRA